MKRTVLVIGAAGGVGGELVKQLLDDGYQVIATVFNDEEAAHLKVQSPGVTAIHHLDLADSGAVVTTLKQKISAIDAVVVCAAICPCGPLEITPLSVLRQTLEINAVSCVAVFQAVMPLLRVSKGRIVFISSFAGKVAPPIIGHYAASKHALEGLGDVMRREAKPFGVRVILVEPGAIRTQMVNDQIKGVERGRAQMAPDQVSLYGSLFDGYATLLERTSENCIEPGMVAKTVVSALVDDSPHARYQVGEDSKFMCELSRKQDAEIDATILALWG